jgi:hypothetical protein
VKLSSNWEILAIGSRNDDLYGKPACQRIGDPSMVGFEVLE